jgi:hypothetical protein
MELTIQTELRGKILHVVARGEFTLAAALRLLKLASDEARENGVRKILIDCLALTGELSTLERYELAVEFKNYLTEKQFSPFLAIVGRPPTVNGFAVQVSKNREMAVEVLPNKEEATTWLAVWPD